MKKKITIGLARKKMEIVKKKITIFSIPNFFSRFLKKKISIFLEEKKITIFPQILFFTIFII